MTGYAHVNEAVPGETEGTFTWANIEPLQAGVNTCLNGDCSLPGETYAAENGAGAVSLYTTDYSAPTNWYTESIMKRIAPLTKKYYVSALVGDESNRGFLFEGGKKNDEQIMR